MMSDCAITRWLWTDREHHEKVMLGNLVIVCPFENTQGEADNKNNTEMRGVEERGVVPFFSVQRRMPSPAYIQIPLRSGGI